MKTIAKKKIWKYLVWLGSFLIAAGVTAGLVSENWGLIPLVLIITGTVVIGLWLIWQNQQNNWWARRSTQASTNALFATLAVLAILGLVNFLGTRYNWRTDLTETKLFTLSPQSRELVRSLETPVKVWVFDANQNPLDRDLLEDYRRQNPKFKFEYVDPRGRPGLTRKFGVKEDGEVYLESGDKRQLVQVVSQQEPLSEIKVTNSLQQVTNLGSAKVYFLQGHGEHPISGNEEGISQAIKALSDRTYTTLPLNLAENKGVPQDATVVALVGPKRALFESEVNALRQFLNRGGNLLIAIDPSIDPKLNSLFAEWGIRLDNRLVVDVSGSVGLGPATPLVREYGKHPITKDFGNGISFYPLARAIDITPVAGVEATPLLLTKPYPDSWAESDLESEDLKFNPESDRKGPLTLGVALRKKLAATPPTQPNSIPTPTASPTPTTQASPAATTKATSKPTSSPTTQAKANPSPSAKPTATASPTPTTQASAKPTATASPTPTTQASPTPTATASPTPTTQASPTPTATASPTTQAQGSSPPPTSPTATESRMVVIGNSGFIVNNLFEQQLNKDVFLNSVTWLSQQDRQPLSISPKEVRNRRINLTSAQANLLEISSLFVLPLIGLLAAGLLWWIRR
ncbi:MULTISPECIES: Gldg family protein [Nostocales]|uniref:ABC transporter n=3 Tax=Nostocales TaxID=1161 RepID=A0A0C1QRV8_9CYAN|nr:Gldg family protein [Tolypothrix bouteillei]KAF3890109.1 ABC transporter [Tolypothrix bouteillei VB521301]